MDVRTYGLTNGQTENRMPISHLAKAGATKNVLFKPYDIENSKTRGQTV